MSSPRSRLELPAAPVTPLVGRIAKLGGVFGCVNILRNSHFSSVVLLFAFLVRLLSPTTSITDFTNDDGVWRFNKLFAIPTKHVKIVLVHFVQRRILFLTFLAFTCLSFHISISSIS